MMSDGPSAAREARTIGPYAEEGFYGKTRFFEDGPEAGAVLETRSPEVHSSQHGLQERRGGAEEDQVAACGKESRGGTCPGGRRDFDAFPLVGMRACALTLYPSPGGRGEMGVPTYRDCAPTAEQAGSATRKAGVRWGC